MRRDADFTSKGTRVAAWHVAAETDDLATATGRPCVVMAHGLGGTRDTGLRGFVSGFTAAGLDVLLFDYRGFGDSDGTPRQHVSYRGQRDDYRAGLAAARRLPGVDPARIVLWGTSYSGGHVLPVAVEDGGVAAAIAMTPAMDGTAALLTLLRRSGVRPLLRLTGHGLRDAARALFRRTPHLVPLAAEPGGLAFLDAPGALTGYVKVAGPTWRNEICARAALEVAMNRPTAWAKRVDFPLLVQIGDQDQTVPESAAARAAEKAGRHATVHHYPLDHFDTYDGGPFHEQVLADQIAFLRTRLGASDTAKENAG